MPYSKTPIDIQCSICKLIIHTNNAAYQSALRRNSIYRCKQCATNQAKDKIATTSKTYFADSKNRQAASERTLKLIADGKIIPPKHYGGRPGPQSQITKSNISKSLKQYYKSDTAKNRQWPKLSKTQKADIKYKLEAFWQLHPELKAKYSKNAHRRLKAYFADPRNKLKQRNITKKLWNNPEYQRLQKLAHNTPEYKQKMAIVRAEQPSCSSLQVILYSILDDLGVKYYREYVDKLADSECIIGPYTFDCVIPREGKKTLLIEVNGDYVHSLSTVKRNDNAKAAYISSYMSDKYELKYLWEHEFSCKDKIIETVKYWIGLSKQELVSFRFDDIIIRECSADEYRPLLAKYHYLPNAGVGSVAAYGAYLENNLIATCIFNSLRRQNIHESLNCEMKEVLEISRFCINPRYQQKNFGSWFISRCLAKVSESRPILKKIISYSDTTYNHDGALYKACNFKLDREVAPDYWYISKDGWVMHKKTLYNKAVNLSLKESEYATEYGYQKVYGSKKLRFVYEL